MDRNELRDYCLSRRAASEDFPFGNNVAVFKVIGKMFALIPVNGSPQISLKCDPIWAEVLRQTYKAVTPGYHLNKKHWNTILFDDTISDDEVLEMVDHAYEQVVKGLTKKEREALEKL